MTNKKLNYHFDASHAWLAVDKTELDLLGISSKISNCSYQLGNTVYLEQDCDMSLFCKSVENKHGKQDWSTFINDINDGDTSSIRRYDHYDGSTEMLLFTGGKTRTVRIG